MPSGSATCPCSAWQLLPDSLSSKHGPSCQPGSCAHDSARRAQPDAHLSALLWISWTPVAARNSASPEGLMPPPGRIMISPLQACLACSTRVLMLAWPCGMAWSEWLGSGKANKAHKACGRSDVLLLRPVACHLLHAPAQGCASGFQRHHAVLDTGLDAYVPHSCIMAHEARHCVSHTLQGTFAITNLNVSTYPAARLQVCK